MQKFAFYETIPTKPPGGSDLNQITDQVKLFLRLVYVMLVWAVTKLFCFVLVLVLVFHEI